MVKILALGFGALTALLVAGSMTPSGQAMLGLRHAADAQAVPVTALEDKPAPIPTPLAAGPAAAPAQPSPAPQARSGGPIAPRPQAAPQQAGPAPRPQAAPQQAGAGGLAGVANILLNLPQVLDQTHVGAAHGSGDSWSESRPPADEAPPKVHKKHHDDQQKAAGDDN